MTVLLVLAVLGQTSVDRPWHTYRDARPDDDVRMYHAEIDFLKAHRSWFDYRDVIPQPTRRYAGMLDCDDADCRAVAVELLLNDATYGPRAAVWRLRDRDAQARRGALEVLRRVAPCALCRGSGRCAFCWGNVVRYCPECGSSAAFYVPYWFPDFCRTHTPAVIQTSNTGGTGCAVCRYSGRPSDIAYYNTGTSGLCYVCQGTGHTWEDP